MSESAFDSRPGIQRLVAAASIFQLLCGGTVIAIFAASEPDDPIREQVPQIAFSVLAILFSVIYFAVAEVPGRLPVLRAKGFQVDTLARRVILGVAFIWLLIALANAAIAQFA